MESTKLLYKNKKSTSSYAEYDEEYLYLNSYQIRILWEEILSIDLIHIRPEEVIIEIKSTNFVDLKKEKVSLLNWFRLYWKKEKSGYPFVLKKNKVEDGFVDFYNEINAVFEARKLLLDKESDKDQKVFYVDKKNFLFWGVFNDIIFLLLTISYLFSRKEGDIFFPIFYTFFGLLFLNKIIRFLIFYKKYINLPAVEITKEALICEFGQVIIPWEEIILIEPYSNRLRIITTPNVQNNQRKSIFEKTFKKFKRNKDEFTFDIDNYKVNPTTSLYKVISIAIDKYK